MNVCDGVCCCELRSLATPLSLYATLSFYMLAGFGIGVSATATNVPYGLCGFSLGYGGVGLIRAQQLAG